MLGFGGTGKFLIAAGAVLILVGLLFTFWQRVPFLGKLPGDISIQRGNPHFFFPLVTCIVISLLLTIILNIVFRLFR
jgi:hypothetical protein